ncbi:N-acetyltransferase [Pelagibius sp. CAU 1746]|uniref:GNAT family N-acetyltransferase n=1 Tax=Pelagibius sp. CAU 1746 TaxID=3140370 RepID=UPI00325AF386
MYAIDDEAPGEAGAREALLDAALGPARFAKTSERLREGRLPELSLAAREDGNLVGSVRLWSVAAAGGRGLLLLGPLAVTLECRGQGIGAALLRRALNRAAAAGHGAVLLVGDAPYYGRFGFSAAPTHRLEMPGPVERHRFLGQELRPGALSAAHGLLCAAGPWRPRDAAAPRFSGTSPRRAA